MRRAFVALAGILALAAPAAAAQLPEMHVEIAPFPSALLPPDEEDFTRATIRGDCALLAAAGREPRVTVWIAEAPAWAIVALAPVEVPLTPASCDVETFEVATLLSVKAGIDAPARAPARLRVGAAVEGGPTNASAAGETLVEAAWFASLNVAVRDPVRVADRGAEVAFEIDIENEGNGPAFVSFSVAAPAPGDVHAVLPEPFTLGSGATGGETRGVAVVTLRAPSERASEGGVVVRVAATSLVPPTLRGDSLDFILFVSTRGYFAPSVPAALVLAAALVAARLPRRV